MNTFAKLDAMKEDYRDLLADAEAIGDRANAAGDLKPKDQAAFAIVTDKANELLAKIEKLEAADNEHHARIAAKIPDRPGGVAPITAGRNGMMCFARGESIAERLGAPTDTDCAAGEVLRALAVGPDRFTPESVLSFLNAQTTTVDSQGAVLVPAPIWGGLIDLARSMMVMEQAGSQMFFLDSETISLPTVVTDPSYPATDEAAAITVSDIVFGSVLLTLRKYAGITYASNELIESGLNTAQRIQQTMAASIAVAVDAALLTGSGVAPEVQGIIGNTDIDATAVAAPVTRAVIDAAVLAIHERNHQPNAVLLSPANYHAIANEAGTTNDYLSAPMSSDGLTYLSTTSLPDTDVVVGDFRQYAIGSKNQIRLETTRSDTESWTKDLTSFRAIIRVDGSPMDASAFQRLTGVTA